jgi:lipid II:glycine glycyltransferase (peptidoglycan interpeptide bridge formation enzyme)
LKDFSEYLDELEQAESSLEAEATTTTTSSVPASATSEEAKNA